DPPERGAAPGQHRAPRHGRVAPHGRPGPRRRGPHGRRRRAGARAPVDRGQALGPRPRTVPRRAHRGGQPPAAPGRRAAPRAPPRAARHGPRRSRTARGGGVGMAAQPGTLEVIARELAVALEPLRARLTPEAAPELLGELGLNLPSGFGTAASAIGTTAVKAAALPPLVVTLVDAIDAEDAGPILAAADTLLSAIGEGTDAMTALDP